MIPSRFWSTLEQESPEPECTGGLTEPTRTEPTWYSMVSGIGKLLMAGVAGAVAALSWATPNLSAEQPKPLPDIVYLISDDQAWSDYSFMGHEQIQTPQLDRLARESLLFTRGYVPDSLCRPSLATMISGLYPHQHGIVGNDPPPSSKVAKSAGRSRGGLYRDPTYQQDIEQYLKLHIDRMKTLPDRLKPLGYRSLQTGKWWEGNYARGGFDAGMTHGDHTRGGRHGDVGLSVGRTTFEPIASFIQESKAAGKPYFLWYAPFLPHTPHTPPQDLLDKYLKLAPTESIAKYWAMCEWFDQSIGQVRSAIEEHGNPDNTIIVYVCDNGWINLPDRSAYAARSKRSHYDGGIRTPIMVHWPGHVEPRRDETHLASSIDMVPTVLGLLGQPADPELPGINLADSTLVENRDTLYGEILEHDIQSMDDPQSSLMYRWCIEGDMKLVVPENARVPDAEVELYNVVLDPWETKNLAEQQPELVAKLRSKIDAWWP
ncbi:sulfatase-like hydrolase/transferase [Aureliella helgolandensis]|uniref:Arylsulfatase n=1 Tax=Aureliella helgolandensis TaxID=2527968 RepID=A0A518G9W7_9BACT|nr:sulfatase-like hydrolase/transferase [Aureliella helgolandensis]QDV25363.1 Arylsulfatase precursor [Aureliella helgolandensis]